MSGRAPEPGDYRAEALDRLTFRRQFILATEFPDTRPGWRRVAIDPRRWADVHPDLEVCQATTGHAAITLLHRGGSDRSRDVMVPSVASASPATWRKS